MTKEIPFELLKRELEDACRITELPPGIDFNSWSIDFLTSYIVNVHHQFLKQKLHDIAKIVQHFADGHEKNIRGCMMCWYSLSI